jgi:DNA-directed RNA polymerase specialized sigma24 family protein
MRDVMIDSFEEIVKEHGKAIFNYIFSLVRQKELAEDLYQEVLYLPIWLFIPLRNPLD